jgi:hypothetical protein
MEWTGHMVTKYKHEYYKLMDNLEQMDLNSKTTMQDASPKTNKRMQGTGTMPVHEEPQHTKK